jgi:hypothetical protein
MQDFRSSMKDQKVAGLMNWDQEFSRAGSLNDDVAGVNTLHNRIGQLKPNKRHESANKMSAESALFHERHPQAAKWSLQSQYYELVPIAALRIQRFWKSVCKRRSFFVSIRYVAAFCILRWMQFRIKGQVGRASGGLHGMHITANYTKEAAHLAHLIFEKNSLRYQMEGISLIQSRRKYLSNELKILQVIQDYQSRSRFRFARDAIHAGEDLRHSALQETVEADERLNGMIRSERIRRIPRPTLPSECMSNPVGPEADGRQVFLLENKTAARKHKECVNVYEMSIYDPITDFSCIRHQRNLYHWNNLQVHRFMNNAFEKNRSFSCRLPRKAKQGCQWNKS